MATKKTLAASRPRAKNAKRALPRSVPAAAPIKNADPLALPGAAKVVTATPSAGPARAPARAEGKPAAKTTATPPVPVAAPVAAPVPVSVAVSVTPRGPDRADPNAAGQEMIETYAICGAIAAKGVESLGKEAVGFARDSARAQLALTEALMRAQTLQEAIEAQSEFTRQSIAGVTAELARLTGLSVDLTQEFMSPIQARVEKTARGLWGSPAA